MKGIVGFVALLTSACCSTLPRLPQKRINALAAVAGSQAVQESSAVWHDDKRNRDVPVKIYEPAAPGGRLPVVIVSHGVGEDRESYGYLGRALAANGFLAVHPTHAGTDKAMLRRGFWKLFRAMKKKENWKNRALDVTFVLDRLSARPDADTTRVAVVGHSAGAFTAFALSGARTPEGDSLRDARVRAIVPMSMPRIDVLHYNDVHTPALNITGTCDASFLYRTLPSHRRVPFEKAPGPNQYLATIADVDHDTFSNSEDRHHAVIVQLTIGFLRAWLLEDANARAWFDDPGTAYLPDERLTLERK